MRVLSIASSLVLAATSLAAVTAPATDSPLKKLVGSVSDPFRAPTTDQKPISVANGVANEVANGAAQISASTDVQNFVDALTAAWNGLNDQSCSSVWQSIGWGMGGEHGHGHVDPDQIVVCVTVVKNAVANGAEKLRIVHRESPLTESDMAAIIPTVFGFLTTLSTFLVGLIQPIVVAFGDPDSSKILEALEGLMNSVSELVEVLISCVVDPDAHVLAPILRLIESVVKNIARLFSFGDVW